MSNKKGFVFIETIVTIVVLSVSLLYIYSSFNNILISEKTRVNYDDIAYIYRTYYIKNFFSNFNINNVLSNLNEDKPMTIIGCNFNDIFSGQSNLINQDANNDGVCDLNCDTNGNGWPDYKVDKDGDGTLDYAISPNDTGVLNIDIDGDSKPDVNIDYNNDNIPDINIDYNKDAIAHFMIEDSSNYSGEKGKYICGNLVRDLGISNIVVAQADLSYISGCDAENTSSKCMYLKNFSDEEITYLETLGNLKEYEIVDKYVMIIEYKEPESYVVEDNNVSVTKNRYVNNYAWIGL